MIDRKQLYIIQITDMHPILPLVPLLSFQTFDILSLYNISVHATDNKSIIRAHWNIVLHTNQQRYSTWSSDDRIAYNKAYEYQNLSIEYKIDLFAISQPFAPCFTILSHFCSNMPLIGIMWIHWKNGNPHNNYDLKQKLRWRRKNTPE
jgi:hypothetical protein